MSIYLSTAKPCSKCDQLKPLSEFYKKDSSHDGHENSCKCCRKKRMAECDRLRYSGNKCRDDHLLKTYLITQPIYHHILLMQGGVCAIYGSENNGRATDQHFVVDHCHATGRVRGLLCHPCNAAIGLLKDNIQSLENAITYLSESA